jgi:hypothetical protein
MINSIPENPQTNKAQVNGTPATPERKPLVGVTKGRINAPYRVCLYGVEGVGKSTTASKADKPVFICKEAGTEQLDIERMPEATHWRNALTSTDGVKNDIVSITDSLRFRDHDYKTLVVDTVDWIEPMLFQYVCESGPKKVDTIVTAYGGFGNGFKVAVNEWRSWLAQLDSLRKERGMNIILLAHAVVKSFNNPEGENYDRYQLKLNDQGAGVIKEWCDAVLFAHQIVFASDKGDERAKKKFGVSDNVRYMFTQRRPAWDAKNRFGLPERMPLEWADFTKSLKAKSPETIDSLVAQVKEAMAFTSAATQVEVAGALERAGRDAERLAILLNWVQTNQEAR